MRRIFFNIIESDSKIDRMQKHLNELHGINGNFIICDNIIGEFHVCNNIIGLDCKLNELIKEYQKIDNNYMVELTKYTYNNNKKIIYIIDKIR